VLKKILVVIALLFFFIGGAFFYILESEWVDFSSLSNYEPCKPSIVLDDQGEVIARFEIDKRQFVYFDTLPKVLIDAFVAAEDHKFFHHGGISLKGMLRSFLVNIYRRRRAQGASTITQQIVRLLFLTSERTIVRKLKEVFLSIQLERQLTKKQIFELYINNIYFGRGIYGVEAACKRFWNKSVDKINVDEAATLAAVAKSARLYSPLNAPENSRVRRNIILRSMYKQGFISNDDFTQGLKKDLCISEIIPGNPMRLYIQEWIRIWAEKNWGRDALYKKGLKIQTTINSTIQQAAEKSFSDVILEWREKIGKSLNGGLLAIETHSGKIKSFIGGLDFNQSQYNRAFQAVRQMGSSFKPIVYTAALQKGLAMNTTYSDEPISFNIPGSGVWEPRNWTNKFEGKITLLRALTLSNNIVTIKALMEVGFDPVIKLAKKFGINRQLNKYHSLALGTSESTVEENTAAFNVFANHGVYVKPYLIEWVKDEFANKIWQHETKKINVLDYKTNSKMVHALAWRMKRSRSFRGPKDWFDSDSIGKTGSTNESTTNWFVGSTPELTTAVYVGRDDAKPLGRKVYGSQTSFPIWLNFYKSLKFKKKTFYFDPALKEVAIDWFTGKKTNKVNDKHAVTMLE
jgi:penicillin-binding protein 1A